MCVAHVDLIADLPRWPNLFGLQIMFVPPDVSAPRRSIDITLALRRPVARSSKSTGAICAEVIYIDARACKAVRMLNYPIARSER